MPCNKPLANITRTTKLKPSIVQYSCIEIRRSNPSLAACANQPTRVSWSVAFQEHYLELCSTINLSEKGDKAQNRARFIAPVWWRQLDKTSNKHNTFGGNCECRHIGVLITTTSFFKVHWGRKWIEETCVTNQCYQALWPFIVGNLISK